MFSYKIVRYPCHPQPECPQGREPLFWPSEQGTHKLGDEESSCLLLLNKNRMEGMCVYQGVNLKGLPLLPPSGSNFLF